MLRKISFAVTSEKILGSFKILSFLWGATAVGAALAFLVQAYMARRLGPSDFGVITGVLTGMGLLVPVASMGVAQFWLQVYGEEGTRARRWISPSFQVVAIGIVLMCVAALVFALLSKQTGYAPFLVLVLIAHVIGQSANELLGSQYQIEGKYYRLAIIQLSPHLARITLIVAAGWWGAAVDGFATVYALVGMGMIAGAGMNLLRLSPSGADLNHEQAPSATLVIKRSLPFGLAGLFHLIYFQSNVTALNWLMDSHGAGQYSAAFCIVAAIYLLPSVLYQKFLLPKLHRWGNHEKKKFRDIFKLGSMAMLVLGGGICVALIETADTLLAYVFGDKYASGAETLKVLALSVPFMFISHSSGAVLINTMYVKVKTTVMGSVALFNIVACVYFIPKFGVMGAAWANVLSNIILASLYSIFAIQFSRELSKSDEEG